MKRRGLIIGASTAVVVLIGAGVAAWVLTRPPTAESAAQRYLDALAAGDFATISDMLDPTKSDDDFAFLGDAFAGAAYGTAPRIEEINPDSTAGMTGVRASIELAGARQTIFFALALENGRWMLSADFLASVEVTSTVGDSVWVGDALAPVGSIALLPAVYPIGPAPRGILTGEVEVAIENDNTETPPVAIDAQLRPDANALAQARFDGYLDECTVPATSLPEVCGIRVPWAADLASLDGLAYRIDQRPAIALSPADGTFAATGGILVATAKGTTHAGSPGEFTYRADDWALYGSVSFTGDEMLLAVR